MSYNPNPLANKQVLDLLAELGRPATQQQIVDILRLNQQTVHARLVRLHAAGKIVRDRSADGKAVVWSLAGRKAQNSGGFARHSIVSALPALEQTVARWYRKAPVQGGLNGR